MCFKSMDLTVHSIYCSKDLRQAFGGEKKKNSMKSMLLYKFYSVIHFISVEVQNKNSIS